MFCLLTDGVNGQIFNSEQTCGIKNYSDAVRQSAEFPLLGSFPLSVAVIDSSEECSLIHLCDRTFFF